MSDENFTVLYGYPIYTTQGDKLPSVSGVLDVLILPSHVIAVRVPFGTNANERVCSGKRVLRRPMW